MIDYEELIQEELGEHVYFKNKNDKEPEYEIPDPEDEDSFDDKIKDASEPETDEEREANND